MIKFGYKRITELIHELNYFMARRPLKEKNIRKLTRSGGGKSLGLTLPIEMVQKLGWRERQKVVVKLSGKKIIIKDWKK